MDEKQEERTGYEKEREHETKDENEEDVIHLTFFLSLILEKFRVCRF